MDSNVVSCEFNYRLIGGLVCAIIAKGGKAPTILALVVFVLGLLLAIPSLMAQTANANLVRTGTVTQRGNAESPRADLGAVHFSNYWRGWCADRRKAKEKG
jgi:hypothetical protein